MNTESHDELSRGGVLSAALGLAQRGFAVLPLHGISEGRCTCGRPNCKSPGKHPRTAHGVHDASTEPERITGWLEQWPDSNLGVAAGTRSGIIVLDVDPRNGGEESFRALQERHGSLPPTLCSQTGGGGQHFFFRCPGHPVRSNHSGRLGPGCDLVAEGGYVVAPPSRHHSGGSYAWTSGEKAEIADCPSWLLAADGVPERPRSPSAPAPGPDRIPEGSRHTQLVSLAGTMRRRGMSEAEIAGALRQVNDDRCDPPLGEQEVAGISASVSSYEPATTDQPGGNGRHRLRAEAIIALAEDMEFFHDDLGDGYASLSVNCRQETFCLGSKQFTSELRRRCWQTYRQSSPDQVLKEALGVLQARAVYDGDEREVAVRVAGDDTVIFLDLADDCRRIVRIDRDGWALTDDCPFHFVRPRGIAPLPVPIHSGSLSLLRPFINFGDEKDFAMVKSWMVGALRPKGPYPVLVLSGEQGAAKSTAMRLIRFLIDPHVTPLRAEPREVRDLMIAANNNHVLAFDNLSYVSPRLSDALCRLATGGGFATRQLYTDRDEVIIEATRPVMLNGIAEVATRSDLIDRSISITLPRIDDSSRLTESELLEAFEAVRPAILGALLEAVSQAIRGLPHVKLERRPRMADFATWAVAAEPALDLEEGLFLHAYGVNRSISDELAVDSSPIGPPLVEMLAREAIWEGTAAKLLEKVATYATEAVTRRKYWPSNPKAMASALRRIAPNLERLGYQVEFKGRQGKGRDRIIELSKTHSAPLGDDGPAQSYTEGETKEHRDG